MARVQPQRLATFAATAKGLETAIAQHPRNFQGTVAQLTERLDEQASQIQIVRAENGTGKTRMQF